MAPDAIDEPEKAYEIFEVEKSDFFEAIFVLEKCVWQHTLFVLLFNVRGLAVAKTILENENVDSKITKARGSERPARPRGLRAPRAPKRAEPTPLDASAGTNGKPHDGDPELLAPRAEAV